MSSGFCKSYCGFHTFYTSGTGTSAINVKYSAVGDPSLCLNACSQFTTGPSPNGDLGVDAMASVYAHELVEAVSDPLLNAWFLGTAGSENADLCSWTFGTMYDNGNGIPGAMANVKLGGKDYLIQQNWLNVAPSGRCGMSYP